MEESENVENNVGSCSLSDVDTVLRNSIGTHIDRREGVERSEILIEEKHGVDNIVGI